MWTKREQATAPFLCAWSKKEHDPTGDFSGLRRVVTPDGSCLWATEEDVEALRLRVKAEAESETAVSWGAC